MSQKDNRISKLIHFKQPIFHINDLAIIWNINNRNSLYTLLKRYTQTGILFRIFKGLYSLYPLKDLDPYLLGLKAIHRFAYVSTESILVENGIIPQIIYDYTFVSSISLKMKIGDYYHTFRKLDDKYLFNPEGIYEQNGIRKAIKERAAVDLLYFNPKAVLDGKNLLNMDKIKVLQKEIGYPLTPHFYVNSK